MPGISTADVHNHSLTFFDEVKESLVVDSQLHFTSPMDKRTGKCCLERGLTRQHCLCLEEFNKATLPSQKVEGKFSRLSQPNDLPMTQMFKASNDTSIHLNLMLTQTLEPVWYST
ncbi:hypothetical protein ACFX15_006196 [Malus domestica]